MHFNHLSIENFCFCVCVCALQRFKNPPFFNCPKVFQYIVCFTLILLTNSHTCLHHNSHFDRRILAQVCGTNHWVWRRGNVDRWTTAFKSICEWHSCTPSLPHVKYCKTNDWKLDIICKRSFDLVHCLCVFVFQKPKRTPPQQLPYLNTTLLNDCISVHLVYYYHNHFCNAQGFASCVWNRIKNEN